MYIFMWCVDQHQQIRTISFCTHRAVAFGWHIGYPNEHFDVLSQGVGFFKASQQETRAGESCRISVHSADMRACKTHEETRNLAKGGNATCLWWHRS